MFALSLLVRRPVSCASSVDAASLQVFPVCRGSPPLPIDHHFCDSLCRWTENSSYIGELLGVGWRPDPARGQKGPGLHLDTGSRTAPTAVQKRLPPKMRSGSAARSSDTTLAMLVVPQRRRGLLERRPGASGGWWTSLQGRRRRRLKSWETSSISSRTSGKFLTPYSWLLFWCFEILKFFKFSGPHVFCDVCVDVSYVSLLFMYHMMSVLMLHLMSVLMSLSMSL